MSHSKPPANSPNPQPVPKDVPPAYKPIKWSFPFVPAGKDDAGSPMTYMKALGSAEDGFFPLGVNGMWHGGIHFGHGTAQLLKQDEGIRAIADGEIVAYRLNRRYPEFQYDDHKWALYSTGFVLIRHRLQLPPSPKKNGSTSARTAAPADEQMTFFSLYMHLLDWDGYQAAVQQAKASPADAAKPTMAPMKYWDGDRWYRVGNTAKDLQEVPKPVPRPPVTDPDPLQRLLDPDYTPPPQPPAPPEPPPPPPIAGVRVFDAANGRAIGLLPRGAELTVGPEKDGWARIATMKSGQPVGPVAGQPASTNVACGWVNLKSLELIVNPRSFDQVVVLKSPVSVDAGEVVGYLGHYLRHGDATLLPAKRTRPLVHLEVFAGADLPAFIAKSRARGAELKEQTFLEIQPGAQLVTKVVDATPLMLKPGLKLAPVGDAQGAAWVQVQPKLITAAPAAHGKHKGHQKPRETAEGKPVWVESNLANQTTTGQERGWLDFPPSLSTASGPAAEFRDVFRRTDLDALGQGRVAKDSQGRCWWYITLANKDGGTVDGWVCEKDHRLTQWCGPWDWPGFEQIDGSSHTPLDLLRRYLFTRQLILADEDQEKFKASALEVNEGPLIKQLTKAIDANHDGNVTAQELARAQQVQWSAEAISHLVVRCESEWGGGMGKWDSLSPLMQRLLSHWKSEMQRIETLQWWDSAKGIEGFPQDTKPWHFHPIGLVGNFISCARKRRDTNLGSLSSYFETGGKGSIVISGGQGDPGGVSYGSYQMTSKTRKRDGSVIIGGVVKQFISQPDFPWAQEFVGLVPGSPEFSAKWRAVVTAEPARFKDVEHEYIKRTHFDLQIQHVIDVTGVDLRYHSHALNDVVWSTCVQLGPYTDVVVTAMQNVHGPAEEAKSYDKRLIDAIYAERGRRNEKGMLVHFIHSSIDQQDGVAKRYAAELPKAQRELENETDY